MCLRALPRSESYRIFFYSSGHHRALHSFPTRRSSDLIRTAADFDRAHTEKKLGVIYSFESPRSEEHTSELQSHSDLVCRLLLEKKKYRPRIASNFGSCSR